MAKRKADDRLFITCRNIGLRLFTLEMICNIMLRIKDGRDIKLGINDLTLNIFKGGIDEE